MKLLHEKYREKTDGELIRLIQQNEVRAFDELYRRYSQKLLFFFYRMNGGNEQQAQDQLQDIFLKFLERINQIDTSRKFSSWIFTVAFNMMKNEYRSRANRPKFAGNENLDSIPNTQKDSVPDYDSAIDYQRLEKAILKEMENFGIEHQCAFLLRFQEHLSIKEISQIMQCPEGTTKSRLFYITKNLAKKLEAFNPNKTEV